MSHSEVFIKEKNPLVMISYAGIETALLFVGLIIFAMVKLEEHHV